MLIFRLILSFLIAIVPVCSFSIAIKKGEGETTAPSPINNKNDMNVEAVSTSHLQQIKQYLSDTTSIDSSSSSSLRGSLSLNTILKNAQDGGDESDMTNMKDSTLSETASSFIENKEALSDSSSSSSPSLTTTTTKQKRSLTEIAHVDDEIDAEAHKKLDTFIDSVGAHAAASVCSVIAVVVSIHLMYKHLQHYSRPLLQRQIIRIVMIVPVYAFCSALSLGFDHYAPYINALRDIYEALCIHCFLVLMLDFPGGEDAVVEYIKDKPKMAHPPPCSYCCPKIRLGLDFIVYMKRTTLQFVVVKPLTAIITVIALAAGVFDTPELQTFLLIVYNLSYTTSLYGLLLFYFATKYLIHDFNPGYKFGAVKIIVFATYYQSLAVVAIPGMDELGSSEKWNDFIICFEMMFFAFMHEYCFSYKEFLPGAVGCKDLKAMGYEEGELVNIKQDTSWQAALGRIPDVCDLRDVISDLQLQFSSNAGQYIMQGVDGGINAEGDVSTIEAREEKERKSRARVMALFKPKIKAEVTEKTVTGDDAAAVGATPSTIDEGDDGADDKGGHSASSMGNLASVISGDFASELATLTLTHSDSKSSGGKNSSSSSSSSTKGSSSIGENNTSSEKTTAGDKQAGGKSSSTDSSSSSSGRSGTQPNQTNIPNAPPTTAQLMAASSAAAAEIMRKAKEAADAAAKKKRAEAAAAAAAAGALSPGTSSSSSSNASKANASDSDDKLHYAGEREEIEAAEDGVKKSKAMEDLEKADVAHAAAKTAAALGGGAVGKATGKAVAALGGVTVAAISQMVTSVENRLETSGLGPKSSILSSAGTGGALAQIGEAVDTNAIERAVKESLQKQAAAAAASGNGEKATKTNAEVSLVKASLASGASTLQQPRLKIDATKVKKSVAVTNSQGGDGSAWNPDEAFASSSSSSSSKTSSTGSGGSGSAWNPDEAFSEQSGPVLSSGANGGGGGEFDFNDETRASSSDSATTAASTAGGGGEFDFNEGGREEEEENKETMSKDAIQTSVTTTTTIISSSSDFDLKSEDDVDSVQGKNQDKESSSTSSDTATGKTAAPVDDDIAKDPFAF